MERRIRLGELLIRANLITELQLKTALAEQQKEDYRGLIRQLTVVEGEMTARQVANSTQTTLDSFFAAQ